MNNAQSMDAQLKDVSAVPTLQLTNHAGKEQVPASASPNSTLPEEPQNQPNRPLAGKDDEQQRLSRGLINHVPTEAEAPVGNGHLFVEGGLVQEAPHVSEMPTSTLGDPVPEDASQDQIPSTSTPAESQQAQTLDTPAPLASPELPISPPRRARSRAIQWLIIGLVILVLMVGSVSAFVLLRSSSPVPATTGTPGSRGVIDHAPTHGVTPTVSTCPGSSATCSATVTRTSSTPVTSNGNNSSTANLTFSDAVIGSMTVTSVVACGPGQSVAGGQQYYFAVFGTISGQQYGFTLTVYPYIDPHTYTSAASSFFGPAGEANSLTAWRSSPNLGVNVTINSDGKSGTLDIGYVSSSNNNNTTRVSGSWKCA